MPASFCVVVVKHAEINLLYSYCALSILNNFLKGCESFFYDIGCFIVNFDLLVSVVLCFDSNSFSVKVTLNCVRLWLTDRASICNF